MIVDLDFDKEVYISVDIEADGPIPGEYSMLNLGAASFKITSPDPLKPISTFNINIMPLPNAKQHPATMKWWEKHQDVWELINKDQKDPENAMNDFVNWVLDQPGKPAFVDYPGSWDFIFVFWYLIKFVGMSPFSFRNLGLATMAFTMLKIPFRWTVKKVMPENWFDKELKHTHIGVDDAIGQGVQFMKMLTENLKEDNYDVTS